MAKLSDDEIESMKLVMSGECTYVLAVRNEKNGIEYYHSQGANSTRIGLAIILHEMVERDVYGDEEQEDENET